MGRSGKKVGRVGRQEVGQRPLPFNPHHHSRGGMPKGHRPKCVGITIRLKHAVIRHDNERFNSLTVVPA